MFGKLVINRTLNLVLSVKVILNLFLLRKWVPGTYGAAAITNFPTPTNDTDYLMYLKLDSVRMDKEFSTMNDNVIIGSSAGINYTTAGIANAKDYVLSNVLAQLNSQSRAVTKMV